MKVLSSLILFGVLLSLTATSVLAHVKVEPTSVGVASSQVFTFSVPNERDSATTGIRIDIPNGVSSVFPTTKSGWSVKTKMSSDNKNVTEVDWIGGSIPVGQRDEFSFAAQVPGSVSTLDWKTYQTYQDGTVVAWDQAPTAEEKDDDAATSGPYPKTEVIDDLSKSSSFDWLGLANEMSGVAGLVISVVALGFSLRK